MLRGIARFALERGGWDFHIEPRGFVDELALPVNWNAHGAIVRLTDDRLARSLRSRKLPAVNVSWLRRHSKSIPKVVADEAACGRLAAEHFLEKRFQNYAFVGPIRSIAYANTVERSYVRRLRDAGHPCAVFRSELADKRPDMAALQRELFDWVGGLPLPVAITVWNGEWGRILTSACTSLGLSIPHDVAVLTVEPDSLMSSLAPVPLTHIDRDGERVGYLAAELLERMILGEPAPDDPVLVPPLRVVEQRSSDVLAVEDVIVREALEFIRVHIRESLAVSDLERSLAVSRRVLEHRFSRSLGHSPATAIRRMKLDFARELLIETRLTVEEVAHQLGYEHPSAFVRAFRTAFGSTPGRFRRDHVG